VNNGQHIAEVKLDICAGSATKRICKMKYVLKNVMITSVRHGGSASGGDLPPTEEVTFAYERIEWKYTEIDDKGNPMGITEGCWDVVSNTGC
jgi:type VI protein secretion system component Hcp